MNFQRTYQHLLRQIMRVGEEVEVGEWQSQDVSNRPEMISRELRHETLKYVIPREPETLRRWFKPNLPWAEDHFKERVSGIPYNPPPSEAWWPFAVRGNEAHKDGQKFSHTYPERIWPRQANWATQLPGNKYAGHMGIRYGLGDLDDVITMLTKNPLTRQAYLPIWFPEDTGAVLGQRVPCTLGYHFLCRDGKMDIVYYLRSCDLLRHFSDDAYMAARLLQHVVEKLQRNGIDAYEGELVMHISSLHIFRGDYTKVEQLINELEDEEEESYGSAF